MLKIMYFKKNYYAKKWDQTSKYFESNVEQYNKQHSLYAQEFAQTFELLVLKIVEAVPKQQVQNQESQVSNDICYVEYLARKNPFLEYYYDYVVIYIKRLFEIDKHFNISLIKDHFDLRKKVNQKDFQKIHEFMLFLQKNSSFSITERKVKKINRDIFKHKNNMNFAGLMYNYLVLFVLLKEKPVFFNEFVVEIIEDFTIEHLAGFFDKNGDNLKHFFNLVIFSYEMYCCGLYQQEVYFSQKYLSLIRQLNVWSDRRVWEAFYTYLLDIFSENEQNLYFTSILKPQIRKKQKMLNMLNLVEFLIFIGFHFIQIPFQPLFDTINTVNNKFKALSQNTIIEISKELEPLIINQKRNGQILLQQRKYTMQRQQRIFLVIRKTLQYIPVDQNQIFPLITLNKYYSNLKVFVIKRLLKEEEIERNKQIKLWIQYVQCSSAFQNIQDKINNQSNVMEVDDRCIHVLKMDVRRTNFAQKHKEKLENLLEKISQKNPQTSYYQGMNCIGGFLLFYTDNYQQSEIIFNFLMKERLSTYFRKNFIHLKKLLFIFEKLLQTHVPSIHEHLEKLNIGNEFFISPILLTIFCSSLQYVENYTLVSKIFDIFLTEGWVGFFKILIYMFLRLEKHLLKLEYDTILEFLNKKVYDKLFLMKFSKLKTKSQKLAISEYQIERIEQEYKYSRKIVDEYWNNYNNNKKKQNQNF